MSDYYVYVYIDPRNYEEFYYGKGKGSRKAAHLTDVGDSDKTRRITEIKKEGLAPIVRVVSRNLTEDEALLVEKTLLWKLGARLTNVSSGHYADNFRPHHTLHKELNGFDFNSGLYYYNVGEGSHRCWEDYVRFGFISAGGGQQWSKQVIRFQPNDLVAAYLKNQGYVGIGQIVDRAVPVRDFLFENQPLAQCDLQQKKGMLQHISDNDLCEYVARVRWLRSVPRDKAKWRPKTGLYTTTHVRASLDGQPKTIDFLNSEFDISLRDILM